MMLGQQRAFRPLYIKQSWDLDRCYQCLTHSQRWATQLVIKNKSGALVTQLLRQHKALGWAGLHCHKALKVWSLIFKFGRNNKKGLTDENNWSCEKITSPLMGVGLLRTKAMWSLDSGSRSLSTLELNTKRNRRLSPSIKHHSNFDIFLKGLVTSYFSCWNIRHNLQTRSLSPDMTGVSLKNFLWKILLKFLGVMVLRYIFCCLLLIKRLPMSKIWHPLFSTRRLPANLSQNVRFHR